MRYNEALQNKDIRKRILLTSLGYRSEAELADDLGNHGGTGRRPSLNGWINNKANEKRTFEKNYSALVNCLSDRPFTPSGNPLDNVLSVLEECNLEKAELDEYTKYAKDNDALSFWQRLIKQMFLGYAFPIDIEDNAIKITTLATQEYASLIGIISGFLNKNRDNPSITTPLANLLSDFCIDNLDNMTENLADLVYELTDYYDKLKDENGKSHEAYKKYARAILSRFLSLREERLCEPSLDKLRFIVGCSYSVMMKKSDTVLRRAEINIKDAKIGFDLAASYYPLALPYDKILQLDDIEASALAALYYSDAGAYYLNVYNVKKERGSSPDLLRAALSLAELNHNRAFNIRQKLANKHPEFESPVATSRFNLATTYYYSAESLLLYFKSENDSSAKTSLAGLCLEKDLRADESLKSLPDSKVEPESVACTAAEYLDKAIDEHILCYKLRVSRNKGGNNTGPVNVSRSRIISTMNFKRDNLPDRITREDYDKIKDLIDNTEGDPALRESNINTLMNSIDFVCKETELAQKNQAKN